MDRPAKDGTAGRADAHPGHVGFGNFRVKLPASPILRIGLGIALVIGGILGFLPVLGFWMLPLGLIVLAVDVPPIHRFLHNVRLRWENHTLRPWLTGLWRRMRRGFRRSDSP